MMRLLTILFWVVVGGALVWQFISYNQRVMQEQQNAAMNVPQPVRMPQPTGIPTPPPRPDGADVQQISFTYDNNVPNQGSITCHVTIQNKGNQKAANIRVQVAPYKGALIGNDEQADRMDTRYVTDNDPVALYTQWLDFPDLAPGDSESRDIVFEGRPGYTPQGYNQRPQILFDSVKPVPATNSTSAPVFPPKL